MEMFGQTISSIKERIRLIRLVFLLLYFYFLSEDKTNLKKNKRGVHKQKKRSLARFRTRLGETKVIVSSIPGMGTSTQLEFYDAFFVQTRVNKIDR